MFRAALLCAALFAAGCGSNVETPERPAEPPPTVTPRAAKPPSSFTPTDIALLAVKGRVKVGDTPDHAFTLLPAPTSAYEFRDLPPGFVAPYAVRGWEGGREGFGVVTHGDLVVAAMYQLDRTDEAKLDEAVKAYEAALGIPTRVSGSTVRYWFWNREAQTLMICALRKPVGLHMTIAMGDDVVLDALGISAKAATEGKERVEESLRNPANR